MMHATDETSLPSALEPARDLVGASEAGGETRAMPMTSRKRRYRSTASHARKSRRTGLLVVRPRVLLACERPALRDALSQGLHKDGMRVAVAQTPAELFDGLGGYPSLVVLDLDLPGEDGLDLLRRLRSASDTPVVLVTTQRNDEADQIVGLELGADDYMISPVNPRELCARIRSILRRRSMASEAVRLRPRTRVRFGVWELDCYTRQLHREGRAPVLLTKSEYALLSVFLGAPHQPFSREDLLHSIRVHEDMSDRSIDVQVLRLRRKLNVGREEVIATLRGIGYVFRAEVETL